jgi:hypothetical protein
MRQLYTCYRFSAGANAAENHARSVRSIYAPTFSLHNLESNLLPADDNADRLGTASPALTQDDHTTMHVSTSPVSFTPL